MVSHWVRIVLPAIAALSVGFLLLHSSWWAILLNPLISGLAQGVQHSFVGIVQLVACAALVAVTARRRVVAFSLLSFVIYEALLLVDLWRYNELHPTDRIAYTFSTFTGEVAEGAIFCVLAWCWWRFAPLHRSGNAI